MSLRDDFEAHLEQQGQARPLPGEWVHEAGLRYYLDDDVDLQFRSYLAATERAAKIAVDVVERLMDAIADRIKEDGL